MVPDTDGFDIGQSTFTTIKDVTVSNQDDCIAFKSGCNFLSVSGITCTGSHGLSVGSLGQTNADFVSNVFVTDATMINSAKAAGIKLYPGGSTHGTATVTNVTWDSVTVQNCDYAAQIQSCYPTTSGACPFPASAAKLSGITFSNWKGTTSTKESPVVSNLDCPAAGTCGITFTNWDVKSPSGGSTTLCNGNSIPGITCTAGATG
jgi:galacturan 1,4-alpha-galacturonidase